MTHDKKNSNSDGVVVHVEQPRSRGEEKRPLQQITEKVQSMGRTIFSRSFLEKRMPIFEWLPKYNIEKLECDILAGVTVGLTVIPQGIAYAVVAGVEPNYGLYSAFVGCFVYMFFGSCKDITIGPTAIMSIMTHSYAQNLPCTDDTIAIEDMAVLLTFLSGVIILLATVFRIGFLITFIGRPVISGFTSAAAITIATSQVNSLLGISFESEGFVETWEKIFHHILETRWQDVALATACIVTLLSMRAVRNLKAVHPLPGDVCGRRAWKKAVFICSIGRNAIVVIISALIAFCLRDQQPFQITGNITPGFPTVQPPHFSLKCHNTSTTNSSFLNFADVVQGYGSGLIIVPLIAILENIAIASAFSQGKAIDATQEMLALGLCNLLGSFFQSIPTTGSFSRTAVNSSSGVRTPAGGFYTGVLVILALAFLTPAFKYIPKASLAAVIVCAVIFMIEYHDILPIWRAYKWDQIPLWVTFLVCLFWALEWGILVGTGIHICLLLYMQATPKVTVSVVQTGEDSSEAVVVVQPALGLMFPSSELVKQKTVMAGLKNMPLLVVLDCSHVTVVDYTSAKAIQNLCKEFSSRQQRVAFACMSTNVKASLKSLTPNLEEVSLPVHCSLVEEGSGESSSAGPHAVPLIISSSLTDSSGNSSPTPLIRKNQDPARPHPNLYT